MKTKISYKQLRKLVSEAISTSRDTGDRISAAISDMKNQRALDKNLGRDTSRLGEVLNDCVSEMKDVFENVTWWDEMPEFEQKINDAIETATEEYSTGTKEEEDDLAGRSTFNPTFQVNIDSSDISKFQNVCNSLVDSIADMNGLSKVAVKGGWALISSWKFVRDLGETQKVAPVVISVRDSGNSVDKRLNIPVDDAISSSIDASEKALFIMGVMKKLKEAGYRIHDFDDKTIWFKLGDSVDEGIIPAKQIMSKIGSQQVDESQKVTLTIGQLKKLARSSRRQ